MSEKKFSLQDTFLNTLRTERIQVAIYLANGIRLVGRIESFDAYVVLLKSNVSQMIYKHAIATIMPSEAVSTPEQEAIHASIGRTREPAIPVITRKRPRELA